MSAAPDPKRRSLLPGARSVLRPLRPPWALGEADFLDACTACGACVEHCPERVLSAGAGRYPVFDPRQGECTFCGACESACPSDALDRSRDAWDLTAFAGDACLPRQGVVCSSCRDACPEQAVRFPLHDRLPTPVVDADCCTGCGACVAVCPVSAMTLKPQQKEPA